MELASIVETITISICVVFGIGMIILIAVFTYCTWKEDDEYSKMMEIEFKDQRDEEEIWLVEMQSQGREVID